MLILLESLMTSSSTGKISKVDFAITFECFKGFGWNWESAVLLLRYSSHCASKFPSMDTIYLPWTQCTFHEHWYLHTASTALEDRYIRLVHSNIPNFFRDKKGINDPLVCYAGWWHGATRCGVVVVLCITAWFTRPIPIPIPKWKKSLFQTLANATNLSAFR